MKIINLNVLAKKVTLAEGKKKSINIGQVKEVINITLKELAKFSYVDLWGLFYKAKKNKK